MKESFQFPLDIESMSSIHIIHLPMNKLCLSFKCCVGNLAYNAVWICFEWLMMNGSEPNFLIKNLLLCDLIFCFCCCCCHWCRWCYCFSLNIGKFTYHLRFINRLFHGFIQWIHYGCDIPINNWKKSINEF